MSLMDLVLGTTTRNVCDHCGALGADFSFKGLNFCCEDMAMLCAWLLEGGIRDAPDVFAYVFEEEVSST